MLAVSQKGNLQGALQELQKLKLKNPQDAAVSNNLATVQLELGDFNRAKDILSKSMRWSPNYAPSYFTMGVVFMREKAFERAGEYLQKAIELQPSMTNAYSVLGKLSLQQGKLQEARNYFEQAIKIGKKMGIHHYALSFASSKNDIEIMRQKIGDESYLISKVESMNALKNLKYIIQLSDAIIIDRGDLSRQLPIEENSFSSKKDYFCSTFEEKTCFCCN